MLPITWHDPGCCPVLSTTHVYFWAGTDNAQSITRCNPIAVLRWNVVKPLRGIEFGTPIECVIGSVGIPPGLVLAPIILQVRELYAVAEGPVPQVAHAAREG